METLLTFVRAVADAGYDLVSNRNMLLDTQHIVVSMLKIPEPTYIHTYIHIYIHMYIHTCISMYIYKCTSIHPSIHPSISSQRVNAVLSGDSIFWPVA